MFYLAHREYMSSEIYERNHDLGYTASLTKYKKN